ncbi:MAG: hypothetical protein QF454_02110 [Candidatus Thalassarchaeaceae archaeon]|nr:hypothetical protein [Candidatus Thalassarchaeaceae archaeon]
MVLAIIALFFLPLTGADMEEPDKSRTANGGRAILLEQLTATWCDTCATIDPWVTNFVDERSNRVVRIAFHPNDHDPFGSPLTTHRIALKAPETTPSLPTFWFDGEGEMEGQVTPSMLENNLRNAESNREDSLQMQVWWDTWSDTADDEIQKLSIHIPNSLPNNTTITVFKLESLSMKNQEIAYNGIDTHHDVATQMIVFRENGTVSSSFGGTGGWNLSDGTREGAGAVPIYILETNGSADGFVTVIEVDGVVRGVIGIYDDENPRNVENDGFLATLLLAGALVTSSILISRSKLQ